MSQTDPTPQERISVPNWATRHFSDYVDHQAKLAQVLDLSRRGILMVTATPKALKVLAKIDGTSETEAHGKALTAAESMAAIAVQEREHDFPILHSQFLVSLWGSLEDLVQQVATEWLINKPEIRLAEPWKNIRIKLGDYEALDPENKAVFLVTAVDQTLGGTLRSGVARFECLLDSIGLGGPVPQDVRRKLFELQQIRNVIVHKRSVADGRFCDQCPWLSCNPGEPIKVGHEMSSSYFDAVMSYSTGLIYRTCKYFGVAFGDEGSRYLG